MKTIDLKTVSDLNASIHDVVIMSDKIYLIALNAMFMSRKTKVGVAGFASVTSQLRTFSGKLNKQMDQLVLHINHLAKNVALYTKQARRNHLTTLAQRNAGSYSSVRFNEVIMLRMMQELEAARKIFNRDLQRSMSLISIGQTLVILAKVEANGTGSFAPVLTSIAEEMERTIETMEQNMRLSLRSLAA